MRFHSGDRVAVYNNIGRLGKGTVKEPPPVSIANNAEMPDYMTVKMDNDGTTLYVKASTCKLLRKKT